MWDCKRLNAHNFVDFYLQTTPTTSEVLRRRSPSRCPPSSLIRQTLRRRDVVQSPFTVVEVDLSVGDDHRCCRKFLGFLRSFSLTGTIFWLILSHFARIQSSRSSLQVLTTFYVVFISMFYWRLASKALQLIRPPIDWSTAMMSHAVVNSDARIIQISSRNIRIRR